MSLFEESFLRVVDSVALPTDKARKIAAKRREIARRKESALVVFSGTPVTKRLFCILLFVVPLVLIALFFDLGKCERCDTHHSISENVEHKH